MAEKKFPATVHVYFELIREIDVAQRLAIVVTDDEGRRQMMKAGVSLFGCPGRKRP